ncbi:substrate-binding periplasmic protein [Chitinimonas sp. JJ19]|uniref:substrate-binding periplasmic protein n=1 Tax=Chitinimonas sp. JJ19 TaxID=3109352 RepID=UPI002FFF25F2
MKLRQLALLLILLSSAHAKEVTMAFGEKIPPFCFPQTNSGIELEVIGEALAYRGHVLKPVYFPFARIPVAFKNREVNAAMTDLGEDLSPYGAKYGDPAVIYDNVLITLKSRNLYLRQPSDLKGLSVISFQGAINRYPDWLNPVKQDGNYYEQNDQKVQVLTLDKGRYDVVLSDRSIFRYFTLQMKKTEGFLPKPVQEHRFTTVNPQDYRPVFRDAGVRDDFNAGLKQLKESGRFQAIYDKYLKE